jgi:hypothetical protein
MRTPKERFDNLANTLPADLVVGLAFGPMLIAIYAINTWIEASSITQILVGVVTSCNILFIYGLLKYLEFRSKRRHSSIQPAVKNKLEFWTLVASSIFIGGVVGWTVHSLFGFRESASDYESYTTPIVAFVFTSILCYLFERRGSGR